MRLKAGETLPMSRFHGASPCTTLLGPRLKRLSRASAPGLNGVPPSADAEGHAASVHNMSRHVHRLVAREVLKLAEFLFTARSADLLSLASGGRV